MDLAQLMKQIEGIENSMTQFQEQAGKEIKNAGTVSTETKNAIDNLGIQQREIADRLLQIEQNGGGHQQAAGDVSMGKQFTDSEAFKNFNLGVTQKARFEVKNSTTTGSDATVAPDRKPGVVGGDFKILTMESLFTVLPTSSNAIEYTRESAYTSGAAETAEGAAKPEATITFQLKQMPVSTVAHWTKISKQLAADAPALAAYINTRMAYGVDQKVDTQLVVGNGTAPNISGFLNTGNFTAHGFADAALGTTLKKYVLIRKIMASLVTAGYRADGIVLNPVDFAQVEIDAFTTVGNVMRVNINAAGQPTIFGVPVFEGVGMTADQLAVGAFRMAGTVHNRQGVVVELSDSDGDNFTNNLVTVRAERRVALTIEKPSLIIAGDLTPA